MNFSIGDIVISKAGKDKNKHFAVLEIDENFVMIANGRRRKAECPKRKKCKHLENTGKKAERVIHKLGTGVRVTNPDLKKDLAILKEDV